MAKTVRHQDLSAYFGEEDHLEISKTLPFSAMVFELLAERRASPQELKVFDLILNLSIDHGHETPSAIPTIEAAKEGKSISESLTAGLLQINEHHGGAVEGAMKNIYRVHKGEIEAADLVREYLENGKRMPGFGHRIYKESDPRTELIFQTLEEGNLGIDLIATERRIQDELERQSEKTLPINIDGSIAVVLCSFEWPPRLGNAVFIIARVPGLLAHYLNNVV